MQALVRKTFKRKKKIQKIQNLKCMKFEHFSSQSFQIRDIHPLLLLFEHEVIEKVLMNQEMTQWLTAPPVLAEDWVGFPASSAGSWWLATIFHSISRESDIFFWPPRTSACKWCIGIQEVRVLLHINLFKVLFFRVKSLKYGMHFTFIVPNNSKQ